MKMNVAIIIYPGSNCADDIKRYFESKGNSCFYIWHKKDDIKQFKFDLLIIPGGFAFGDRYYKNATDSYTMDPGKMALESPVTKIILDASKQSIPILGICNGFQILIQLGLLPGKLLKNINNKFTCKSVKCFLNNGDEIMLDVANSYGNYQCNTNIDDQVFLKYDDGYTGSLDNIAGVCSKNKLIYGMMPHPERTIPNHNCKIYETIIETMVNRKKIETMEKIETLMSSEHISYKSTRKYLKNLYTSGDHVIQGPGENAGIVDLGDGYCLALRIESHNHPIFIDPYNGSATGVGGILRDIFTMGARPIAVCDFTRFGTDSNSDKLLSETVRGISDYANCFGVANVGGNCYRDSIYNKNPLLNVACFGIMKKDKIVYGNALNEDSLLIYAGSKTGNEGINGAEMASNSFTKDTNLEDLKSNIQTGDPFLEKLLLESCLEIIEYDLVEGMQDMGAGGVLCSSLEVIERGRTKTGKNLGCVIYTDNIQCKHRMDDCDKLISESQERMLVIATPNNRDKIFEIFNKWDLEYSVIGKVNNSGSYVVVDNEANGNILYENKLVNFSDITQDWSENRKEFSKKNGYEVTDKNLWDTYDSTIGARTVSLNRNNDFENYSVISLYEINKNMIIAWGDNVEECYKTITRVQDFKPLGIINCLNYGHPSDSIGELSHFVREMTQKCEDYNIPILGGNVSLYNATDNVSIPPSPVIVMIGIN